jgi:hypothetical protein
MYQGESITFPLDESLLRQLTEWEKEQIAEIIDGAGQMIERDDGILTILSGLKALGYERGISGQKNGPVILPVRNSSRDYIITDKR